MRDGRRLVNGQERRRVFLSHVAIQHPPVALRQVDQDQRVQRLGKFVIHAEAEDLATEFQILF